MVDPQKKRGLEIMKLGKRGFTLVEIMIVVAIISLLAAIAIPNLLRAKHNANESAAIHSLATIREVMESYYFTQTPPSYSGASLSNLANMTPPYIDERLGTGQKQGYSFLLFMFPGPGTRCHRYFCMASPLQSYVTGTRQFLYTNFDTFGIRGGCIYYRDPSGSWQPLS